MYTGSTSAVYGEYTGSCGDSYYPIDEDVFVLTLIADHTVTFETDGTIFDTLIYLRNSPCDTGTEIDCDDDGGYYLDSHISQSLSAGTYYFFLDGYDDYEYGSYTLTVTIS